MVAANLSLEIRCHSRVNIGVCPGQPNARSVPSVPLSRLEGTLWHSANVRNKRTFNLCLQSPGEQRSFVIYIFGPNVPAHWFGMHQSMCEGWNLKKREKIMNNQTWLWENAKASFSTEHSLRTICSKKRMTKILPYTHPHVAPDSQGFSCYFLIIKPITGGNWSHINM